MAELWLHTHSHLHTPTEHRLTRKNDKTVTTWLLLCTGDTSKWERKRGREGKGGSWMGTRGDRVQPKRGETFGAAAISYQRHRTVTSRSQSTPGRDASSHPNPQEWERERQRTLTIIYALYKWVTREVMSKVELEWNYTCTHTYTHTCEFIFRPGAIHQPRGKWWKSSRSIILLLLPDSTLALGHAPNRGSVCQQWRASETDTILKRSPAKHWSLSTCQESDDAAAAAPLPSPHPDCNW